MTTVSRILPGKALAAPESIVIVTNIFFALLLCGDAALRKRFLADNAHRFHCPRFVFVELFKHKERITQATELSEEDLLECLHELFARVRFIDEGGIPIGTWMEARRLCRDVDPKDAPFIALTLHLDGRRWTGDDELKAGLRAKECVRFCEP
ncbi:MAG: PIN domain-containing protein [Verrucomicrobiota bacterium]|jgi:predicted nucleic acid-binding protein